MSEKPFKMTWTRADMLSQVAREPGPYASHYPPLKALLAQGYVTEQLDKFGQPSGRYAITTAGRRAHAEWTSGPRPNRP